MMKGSSMASGTNGAASSTTQASISEQKSNQQHKIMITGDDILIEYVARLSKQLAQGNVDLVKPGYITQVEKFVIHYVWKQPD